MFLISPLIELYCRIRGPKVTHKIYLARLERWRTFEPEYYLLKYLVDPKRASVDIGANEGLYSGRLSQLSPRVHSFEPIPWFASKLRGKLEGNVVVHEIALSNRSGTAQLRIPYHDDIEMHGTSTLEADNPLPGSTRVRLVDCAVGTLDDVVKEPVGFIKVDVEGHEVPVLEGAKSILLRDRPVVFVETEHRHNADAPEATFAFLEALGYTGFFLKGGKLRNLCEFEAARDQDPRNVRNDHAGESADNKGMKKEPYVNNFIFTPGWTYERLAETVKPHRLDN
jgi:FkbM family methyltransferase